jgi:phosphatidylglycerophosphatase A
VGGVHDQVMGLMASRGVSLRDIARIVYFLQRRRCPDLTVRRCEEAVAAVLRKREAQFAVLTGVALDQLAEEGRLPAPLQELVVRDDPLYGVDEVLALAITQMYGAMSATSFGFLDKRKPGVLRRLHAAPDGVHTFLDDLVAAVAAAAAARLAHADVEPLPAPEPPASRADRAVRDGNGLAGSPASPEAGPPGSGLGGTVARMGMASSRNGRRDRPGFGASGSQG